MAAVAIGHFDRNQAKYRFCGCIHSETAVLILTWFQIVICIFSLFATFGGALFQLLFLVLVLFGVYKSDHRYLIPYLVFQFIGIIVLCLVMVGFGVALLLGKNNLRNIGGREVTLVLYLLAVLGLLLYIYFSWIPYIRSYDYLAAKRRASHSVHIYVDGVQAPTYQITQNNYHPSVVSPPPLTVGFHHQTNYLQAPPIYQALPTAPPANFEKNYQMLGSGYPV